MPFTVVAYADSLDPVGALLNFPAVADPTHTTVGNYVYLGSVFNKLLGHYCVADGTTAVNYRIISPSLRRVIPIDASNVHVGTDMTGGFAVNLFPSNPIALMTNEGVEVLINSNPAAAAEQAVVLLLSDGALTPIGGEIFTLRATATITGAVETWVSGALTFGQTLPVGRYGLVGARVEGVLVAARFVIPGVAHRPGCPPVADDDDEDNDYFRYGKLGVWAEFDSTTPPQLEVLTGSASAAQTVYLDLIKIA